MIEPPLGWSLSEAVREAMDQVMDDLEGGLDREMGILRAALAGSLTPEDRCNPR
jgi:hypothetical protein